MKSKILILIFSLAFVVRVIGLAELPSGFTPDEASFGYDAYSLLETGKDQWGNSWPLVFKSFGDYKLPLYGYLAVPSVSIFGLNEFAVRLPNALTGFLAVVVTYYLVKELFKDEKAALLSAFLLAISPWHIPLSRGAFEANLTTFLMPLAILLFYKGVKNNKYLPFSFFVFGLNMFSYHSARYIVPLLLLFLLLQNRKKITINLYTSISVLVILVLGGLFLYSWSLGTGSRLLSSGIFLNADNVFIDRVKLINSGEPLLIAKIFNNKFLYLFNIFLSQYVSYFSPQFLLLDGPKEGTYGMVPGVGVLYFFEYIFVLSFAYVFIKKSFKNVNWLIVWLLLAPIPAALSTGLGHAANRAAIMMPAIQIASALGGIYLFDLISKDFKLKYTKLVVVFVSLSLICFIWYLEKYTFHQPALESPSMLYGMEETVDYVSSVEGNYSNILISKKLSEPHIYFAFYGKKINPTVYQNSSKNWDLAGSDVVWVDQLPRYELDKYKFISIDWSALQDSNNTLIIGKPEEFPENVNVIKKIFYPDGREAIWIVDPINEAFASLNFK